MDCSWLLRRQERASSCRFHF